MSEFRSRFLSVNFIKFAIVGVSNNVISFSVFYFLTWFGVLYPYAFTLSYVAGLANSYVWNKRWTFQSKNKIQNELFRFVIVYLITYGFNLAALAFFIEIVELNPNLSFIISTGMATLFSFTGHRLWSFRTPKT